MLTTVSVVPPEGAFWPVLSIPVLAPDSSGVFIQNVKGLEPVTADITTNTYNELDGDFYVGSRVGERNIVLSLVMEPGRDSSVSDIRKNLYGYFTPQMNIVLQFDFTDRDPVKIEGYVESFEGDRFSQEPNADVSIICPKPNFQAIEPIQIYGQSYYGTDPPLTDVLNPGDRMVGFELHIANNTGDTDFDGTIHIERMIEGSIPGEYFSTQILYLDNFDGNISLPSDYLYYLYVNTKQGEKVAEIRNPDVNDEVVANLLQNMTDESGWPVLWSAMHKFRVVTTDTTGWTGKHLTWTLTFTPEWGGV